MNAQHFSNKWDEGLVCVKYLSLKFMMGTDYYERVCNNNKSKFFHVVHFHLTPWEVAEIIAFQTFFCLIPMYPS